MANWKEVLAHFVEDVEEGFDRMKYGLGERLGGKGPIRIRPYRGYGTQEEIYLKGRVLEGEELPPASENDNLWDNLVNTFKRFESDEVPHARVRARFAGDEAEVAADEEGYFEVILHPKEPLPSGKLWGTVGLDLLEPLRPGNPPVSAVGEVFIPPPQAQFGVISDIDDTVLQTDATQMLKMARTVFLGNARTRLPFKGAAAFYRALFQGTAPEVFNPLFYVSSSPWNLYGLLSEFFQLQDIPFGPVLFLRDWGISEDELLPIGHRSHKLQVIRRVLDHYQDLPFILIGDSGQEDPEIYAEVVSLYPERIKAIYIRNVSKGLKRPKAIEELAKTVTKAGSTLILAEDTLPMAQHAAEQGWISPQMLAFIEADKRADEAPPTPVEKLLGEPVKEAAPTVVIQTESPQAAQQAVETAEEVGKETKQPPTVVIKGEGEQEPLKHKDHKDH
jgi:phosphatidate phosphatase APP1